MLKNKDIICISSIDWDFIWQGHQEIMSAFAKNGNRVLFVENTGVRVPGIKDISRIKNRIKNWLQGTAGIRKITANLYVLSPLVLPFPYLKLATWVNRRIILSILEKWIKIMDFTNPILWVFLPTPLSLDLINNLDNNTVVYYCIDNFRASSVSAKKIKSSEKKLLKRADLVFATSRELYNYCRQHNNRVYLFPFAVNFQEFEEARKKNADTLALKDIKRPIIGYVGGVHKWIDLQLVKESAIKFPQFSFVFIGPVQTDISLLSSLKNVYFMGKKDHKEISYLINNFDVCLIPYLITNYTKNVYPTKLNEYLAMGKPVVATDLPEVRYFNAQYDNLILVGKSREDFMLCIEKALTCPNDAVIKQRIDTAQKNSWAVKIEEMSNLIEDTFVKKLSQSVDWQENFIRLYRKSRRKTLRLAAIAISIYLLFFYTPFIWLVAKPLKITQEPQQADCILVFAGGVGESGKAEQGYEERVQRAVELYKKGYAANIIFSSGYMYIFKEPLVMKAVAVSLGIPENAILIEDKAINTYQNIKFSKEILDKNNWKKILLVSSPYHMRRVLLVFDKIARDIKVTYAPVTNSLFYSHPKKDNSGRIIWKRASLNQIKAVIHEYLGIFYYWWKGYI